MKKNTQHFGCRKNTCLRSAPVILFFSILFALSINASAQIITRFAGTGVFGFSGDGGPATAAEFFNTRGVAVDAANNVYISDYANSRIRKVSYPSGIITTFAGNGSFGYSGDGGPATLAKISLAWGLAVDRVNNLLYISDLNNDVIRMVDLTTNIITTVAGNGIIGYTGDGGPATLAKISGPAGVGVDAAGNLYIADQGNHAIRMVDGLGIISTVAGIGTAGYSGDLGPATLAQLNMPQDVCFDASGNMYIGDENNDVVRIVSGGIINTFAGNNTAGYSGDGGPATLAQLNHPHGVVVDAAGNLYIGDGGNVVIRKVDVTGKISTYAGNGTPGFTGDGGPATAAELNEPTKIALDPGGCLYITGKYENRVRRVCGDAPHPCYDDAKLDVESYVDDKGNCVYTLTANVTTLNEVIGYQWQGVGPAVIHHTHATSDSYTFTLPPGGSATVGVTIYLVDTNFTDTTGPCCQAYLSTDVKCDGKPGKKESHYAPPPTEKMTIQESFSVFPNPTEDAVNVTSEAENISSVQVIDVNGKKVASYSYKNVRNANVSLEKLPPGNYLLRINNSISKVVSKSK